MGSDYLVAVLVVAAVIGGNLSIQIPVVKEIPADIEYGTTLLLKGMVKPDDPWKFNIGITQKSIEKDGTRGDIAFNVGFIFRRKKDNKSFLRANYRQNGKWGNRIVEENPLDPGEKFDLELVIQQNGFMVLVNDVLVISRPHHLLPLSQFHYFIIAGDVIINEAQVN